MLVIQSGITLPSAEAALPSGTPLILWDTDVEYSNVTATSEETSYPASNLGNPATTLEWRATSTAIQYLTVPPSGTVDAVGLARHNFGTAGIAVSVEVDSGGGYSQIIPPFTPTNDDPILMHFTGAAYTGVRVKLAVGSIAARLAVYYAGKMLRLERGYDVGADFTPPEFARKTDSINGMSHRGDYLGRIITSQFLSDAAFDFRHFTPSWYRTYFDPFIEAAQTERPFFFAWSPTDYPNEVTFAWLMEDPMPRTSPVTGRVNVTLKMGGILA
jgi:hypothetical protein